MEKFRIYADPQTGINLFVPAFANYKLSIVEILQHIVLYFTKIDHRSITFIDKNSIINIIDGSCPII